MTKTLIRVVVTPMCVLIGCALIIWMVPQSRVAVCVFGVECSTSPASRRLCASYLHNAPRSAIPQLVEFAVETFGGRNFDVANEILEKQNQDALSKELENSYLSARDIHDKLVYLWLWFAHDNSGRAKKEVLQRNINNIFESNYILRRGWLLLLRKKGVIAFDPAGQWIEGDALLAIKKQIRETGDGR